jgi:hypothetical protein
MSEQAAAFLPRWALYLLLPGLFGPLLILGFIFVSELAHDESRCPYERVQVRQLTAAVAVREDRRSCVWGIAEHRFSVLRGTEQRSLGRRRFAQRAFAPENYRWEAKLSAQDEVQVTVHNRGHVDASFREGTSAERSH